MDDYIYVTAFDNEDPWFAGFHIPRWPWTTGVFDTTTDTSSGPPPSLSVRDNPQTRPASR